MFTYPLNVFFENGISYLFIELILYSATSTSSILADVLILKVPPPANVGAVNVMDNSPDAPTE